MKRIIVWITVLSLIIVGVFAMNACNRRTDENGVSYELNTPARDELNRVIITYGEQAQDYLSRITVTKIENGVSSTVPVDPSMLVTEIDTSVVDGNGQILQFSYAGQMFSVPIVVKYKVEFVADGHVCRIYHVHNKKGLDNIKSLLEEEARTASGLGDKFDPNKLKLHELLAAPEKAGYSFVGWSEEGHDASEITNDFPSIIKSNITFTAIYEPEREELPELPTINAVYGDLLADIELPSVEGGEWQFKDATGTVGNAGENTFEVQLVKAGTNEVLEERTVTVLVAKKVVNFSSVVESFVYNGQVQLPAFQTDAPDLNVENIRFNGDDSLNYTDAGKYDYSFVIVDDNYEGTLEGTFEIKPIAIEVVIKLEKDTIGIGDSIPEVTYELSVPEGMNATDFKPFISVVIPTVDGVGEYTVTAATSNKNITLSATPAILTVELGVLNVDAPSLINGDAIYYGYTLSDVRFGESIYGWWEWVNPDELVGNVGKAEHLAVFIPMADEKYEKEYCSVEIDIKPRKLTIEIDEKDDTALVKDQETDEWIVDRTDKVITVNYDPNKDWTIIYSFADGLSGAPFTIPNAKLSYIYEGETYEHISFKSVGQYVVELMLDAGDNYEKTTVEVTFIIKSIAPEFEVDNNITVTWKPELTLGQIVLPTVSNGYFVWGKAEYNVDSKKYEHNAEYANTVLNSNSNAEVFTATFIPYDEVNYELVYEVAFQVKVNKTTPVIEGVEAAYDFIYDGSIHKFSGATVNPDKYGKETPEFTYTYEDGRTFEGVTEAGVYTILVTLPEGVNNESVQVAVTVTVAKADPEKPAQLQSAIYGDLASVIVLPAHEQGAWSLKGVDEATTVGAVGRHTFVALFTPATGNYNAIEVSITVDVAKKSIRVPEISNQTLVYTGALLTSGLTSAEGYTVIDNGGINVGTYTVQIILDDASYAWSTIDVGSAFELTYDIVRADNVWTDEPNIKSEWTYGDIDGLDEDALAEYKGTASALVGDVVVLYAPQGTEDFGTAFPTNAGKYTAKFIVTDSNYNDLVKTIDFVIHKKVVLVPAYTATYLYTGNDITADIQTSALYSITGNVAKNVGKYEAILTLNDSANYVWSNTDSKSIVLKYDIITSGVALTITLDGWTYGQTANAPVVTVNKTFSDEVSYIIEYSEDGVAWATNVFTDAGTYIVRARVEDTANYNGAEATCSFTIAKAAVTVGGVENTYSKDYNGEAFAIPTATASNGATVKFVITKDGATVDAIVGVGEYVITYSVAENANYLAATKQITVTVDKADVTVSKPVINGWTYGNTANAPSAGFNEAFAKGSNGEITFKYYTNAECTSEITTPVNAGTYYVKAFFAGNENLNACESEATSFVIAKKAIVIPTVSDKAYNGQNQASGLADTTEYTVVDAGGTNVGTYTAVVTLVSDNYVWADGTSVAKELTYEITSIDNIEEITTSYTATYGDLLENIITLPEGVQGTWSIQGATAETTVGNAGVNTFVAVFTPDENGNYNALEVEITVTVAKAVVNVPTEYTTEYVYTGSNITAAIPTSTLYNVTGNVAKNVGSYNATLTLADNANYKWNTTDAATVTVPYGITKASLVLSDLALSGWAFGQTANVPTVTVNKKFAGDVIVSYEYLVNGIWVADAPASAGTYTVKATVADTSNYTGDEITAEFTIAKASVTVNGANDSYTTTYNGNAFTITGVVASNGADITKVITKGGVTVDAIIGVGEYVITYSVAESANYKAATREVRVTVNPADVTISKPVIEGWTYGESANTPSAHFNEAFAQGEITFMYFADAECAGKITVLANANAGTYYVKAFFAGNENLNACESEATEIVIAKKAVAIPSVSDKAYTGALQTSGLVAAEGYTVVDDGGTNVGAYTAVVTLVSDNYVWADGTSVAKELTYEITSIDNIEEITTSYTATYGDLLENIITLPEGVQGTWSIQGATAETTVGNAGVNTFVAVFTPDENGNYNAREVEITVTVGKKTVEVPTEYTTEYVYTGSNITAVIPTSTLYTVTNNVAMNVGSYSATLTLTDNANYVWSNGDILTTTVPYSITKASLTVSITLGGWTYGQTASTPAVIVDKAFVGDVPYVVEYSADGEIWSKTVPTEAGSYQVRAVVQDDNNYFGYTSEAYTFAIAKATASINGVEDSYSKVYDGNAYVFPSTIRASHNESVLQFAITKNGTAVDAIVDAGEYKVVITLAESDNYRATSVEFTVEIAKADNADTVITEQNATYGDEISVIVLPTSTIGTWTIKETVTTVGYAGVNTFTALFTPSTENYESREVTITVTVAKKVVEKPIINPVEYTGDRLYSGLVDTEFYTVVDNGGIDHGEYDVVLTLVDSNNYKWEDSDTASTAVKFIISTAINKWEVAPTITTWEYESAGDHAGKATALHGGVLIEYKLVGAPDSEYNTELPTVPGDYIARFTTTDDNYTILVATKTFSITKRKITPPTQAQTSFIYTGSLITSGLTDGTGYAVVADEGRINVGSFTATVSLTSEYYVWADGTSADKTFTYSITPATNTEEVTTTYTAIYGDLAASIITLPAGVQGTWSIENVTNDTVVGNVGTRTFTVVFTPDAIGNYSAREVEITITVEKASVAHPTVDKQEGVEYTGNKVLSGVESTDLYTVADIGGVVVGTHKVQFTLTDKNNYKWQDGDSDDLYIDYVTIVKAQNRDEIPTYTATYGDSIATLALPTTTTGSWKWQTVTVVGNVGETNEHTLVFTPADAANYAERTVVVTVTVNPKPVTAPTISAANLNQVYTGEALFSGLTDGEGYTVDDNGGTNVGSYTATVSLASQNYVWTDGTSADVKLTYNITPATNTQEITTTYTATYGDLLSDIITLPTGVQGTWSIQGATAETTVGNAGKNTFTVVFTPDETGNYNAREVEITVTVGKKAIDAPVDYTKEYTYTGSDITAVIPTSALYTVTGNVAKNVGSYSATLTLADSANYKWATTDATAVTVPYSITKATVTISDLTIVGWTYNQAANAPIVTISKTFSDAVSYIVEYSEDGIAWSKTVPADAGTYTVRATVEEADNYNGDVATCELTIAKADVTIGGVNDTYTKDYNGEAFIVPSATASNGLTVKAVITKNGVVVEAIVDAGEYVITYSVAESANYLAQTRTVNVTVAKADVTISKPVIDGWTYGESAKAPSAGFNETFAQGTITFKYFTDAECTDEIETLVNAGTYYVKAIFAGNDNLNAYKSEATAFVIAKLALNVPTVTDKVYNGQQQTAGIPTNAGYTVVDNGGINVGTYTAVVTLVSDNYIWADGTSAAKELTYEITSIDNTQEITTTFVATYDDLLSAVITLPEGVQGTWSIEGMTDATTVGNAGTNTFKAIFTPDETGNYNAREVEITVTVGKKAIDAPVDYTKEYAYTGSDITANIPTSTLYTITNNVAKNVGSYSATLTLTDSANYKWATTSEATVTVPYSITKASVTLSNLVLSGWTYNQTANVPTVTITKEFAGEVTASFEYLVGDVWVEDAPKNAGTYTVKAVVDGTSNYAGAEITAEFTIAKASVTINGVNDSYSTTYTGSAFTISGITASNGATVTKVITKDGVVVDAIVDAGEYVITYSVAESANYKAATETVTVTVDAADVTISKPVIDGWTYGNTANAPSAGFNEAFAQGEITFKYYTDAECTSEITTLEGANAGTYYVKAFFAGDDNLNAAKSEATKFVIGKKEVAIPSVSNKVYNGEQQTSGLVAAEGYTVVDNGGINAGTYTATVTLASDNYVWADGTSAAKALTYSITKATVTVGNPTITGWISGQYDAATNAPSVTTSITDVTVTYEYYVNGVWGPNRPTLAGSYAVKAVVEETDNYFGAESSSITFTITVAEVSIPTVDSEYLYTGSAQKPTIADSVYYTVEGNDAHTATGEYTITIVPTDTYSFVWAGQTTEPETQTLTYKITKGTITLSGLTMNNWVYNETASTPTVTVTKSFIDEVTVCYEYFAADGTSLGTTRPTNAGSYSVKAIVAGTANYDGVETEAKAFTITKASASWTDPTFTGAVNGKYYMNKFGYSTEGLSATHAGAAVSGTFKFSDPTFVEGESNSYIKLTFTPTDAANYATVEKTYYATFVTVAINDSTSTSYGSIESALAAAVSGNVVRVLPHDSDLGAIYIMSNVEIKSGVTLVLPYGATGSDKNTYDENGVANFTMHGACTCTDGNSHTYSSGLAGENLCIVKVTVAQNVTVTNKGTLEISGQLSGGGAGEQYAGHTGGYHARLLLDTNATIDNYGVIRAAGFIREVEGSTGSQVIVNNGSTLYQPYVLKDYISGQYLVGPYKQMENGIPMTPFNMFMLMNVSPTVTVKYGGSVITWAALYTGSTDGINTTQVTMIGTDGVIDLTTEQSYLTAKYDPTTEVCKLDVYGGATTNSMKLSVNILVSVTIDTIDTLFPFSYLYDVTLHSGAYTMDQRFKMMPGAKLTVAEDATLNIDTLIVYDETFKDERTQVSGKYLYPANKGAAIFTVNGSVTCGTLGGKVYSNTEDASVTIKTAATYTAYEPKTYTDGKYMAVFPVQDVATSYAITQNAQLVNADNTKVVLASATTGEYINGAWRVSDSLKLHFDSNGGSAQTSVDIFSDDAYPALPTPTREHYVFAGWKDSNGNIVTQGDAVKVDRNIANGITLIAQWTLVEYNLNYEWKFEGFDTNPTIAWAESFGKFNIETAKITLPTPTNATGTFVGWFTDAACENLITGSISGAELVALWSGDATIYGKWTNQQYTVKFEGDHFDDVSYTNDTVVYTPSTFSSAVLPTIPNTYETDITVNKYFEGWYYNGTKVTDLSFVDTSVSGEYTVTAKWIDKVSITYTANNTSVYTSLITNGSTTLSYSTAYWYKSGTSITLPNVTANDGVTTDATKNYYFGSWTLNGSAFSQSGNSAYTLTANTVIHINWLAKVKVTPTWGSNSGQEAVTQFTVGGVTVTNNQGVYLNPNTQYTVTAKADEGTISSNITGVTASAGTISGTTSATAGNTATFTYTSAGTDATLTVASESGGGGCFTPDTLVTLADGTQKRIKDVEPTDILLVWNFHEGKYDEAPISILMNHGYDTVDVLTLVFADGTTIGTINGHGFFDEARNEFVIINTENVADFVGHSFVKLDGDSYSTTELVGYSVETRYTEVWSVLTAVHYNAIIEGMWSVTEAEVPNSPAYLMPFVVGEDMKYDSELMQADIEKYGLYTYEEFAMYCTKEQFEALGLANFKVAVGKGYITYEQIIYLLELHCS